MGIPEDNRFMYDLYVWYSLCATNMYDVVHVCDVVHVWALNVM